MDVFFLGPWLLCIPGAYYHNHKSPRQPIPTPYFRISFLASRRSVATRTGRQHMAGAKIVCLLPPSCRGGGCSAAAELAAAGLAAAGAAAAVVAAAVALGLLGFSPSAVGDASAPSKGEREGFKFEMFEITKKMHVFHVSTKK